MWKEAAVFAAVMIAAAGAAADTAAPYAGWQARDIKALSPEAIEDLKAGRGMGLALAAELNGYPGPRHVLDLGDDLNLTDAQRTAFEELFRTMQVEAQRLGHAVLAEEADLDTAFRSGRIDEAGLGERLSRLAALQGELRLVHLRTHLAARALLSPVQVAQYNVLRGYAGTSNNSVHGGHGSHGHTPVRP